MRRRDEDLEIDGGGSRLRLCAMPRDKDHVAVLSVGIDNPLRDANAGGRSDEQCDNECKTKNLSIIRDGNGQHIAAHTETFARPLIH